MCNRSNPAGDFTSSGAFERFNLLSILLCVAVTMKRYWMAHYLARRLYYRYCGSVRSLVDKLAIFTEMSSLAFVRRPQCNTSKLISFTESHDDDTEQNNATGISPHPSRHVHDKSLMLCPLEKNNVSLENWLEGTGQSEALDVFSYLDEQDEPSDVKKWECVSSTQNIMLAPRIHCC